MSKPIIQVIIDVKISADRCTITTKNAQHFWGGMNGQQWPWFHNTLPYEN